MFFKTLFNQKGVTLIELLFVLGVFSCLHSVFGLEMNQMQTALEELTQQEDVVIFVSLADQDQELPHGFQASRGAVKVKVDLPERENGVVIFISLASLEQAKAPQDQIQVYVTDRESSDGVVIFISLSELNQLMSTEGSLEDHGIKAFVDYTLTDSIIDIGDLPDGLTKDGIIDVGDLPDGFQHK